MYTHTKIIPNSLPWRQKHNILLLLPSLDEWPYQKKKKYTKIVINN